MGAVVPDFSLPLRLLSLALALCAALFLPSLPAPPSAAAWQLAALALDSCRISKNHEYNYIRQCCLQLCVRADKTGHISRSVRMQHLDGKDSSCLRSVLKTECTQEHSWECWVAHNPLPRLLVRVHVATDARGPAELYLQVRVRPGKVASALADQA